MNNELIVRINVISNTLDYWETNDPVIAIGDAAHVVEQDSSIIRVGNGKSKWSQLPETHIDSFVPSHAGIHTSTGRDPLLATNEEVEEGTSTTKAITVAQFQALKEALIEELKDALRDAGYPEVAETFGLGLVSKTSTVVLNPPTRE